MLMRTYKKEEQLQQRHQSDHCCPEVNCSDMAPCSANYHTRISDRDNIKLRKPIVEKMRRDRINSCIEQLKVILEKEFHKQEPNSKLEKADILEMTVSFLRQQLQPGLSPASDYHRGFSHCWNDSMHFFSNTEVHVAPLQGLQQQLQSHRLPSPSIRPTTLQDSSSSRSPVWRPW